MSFVEIMKVLCIVFMFAPYLATRVRMQVESQRWVQCAWAGPTDSGFSLTFPMRAPGSQGDKCTFACKRKLWDLNVVMSEFFQPDVDIQADKCNCFLEGAEKVVSQEDQWFYRFPKRWGECSAAQCWIQYQSLMNHKKDKNLTVSTQNMPNIGVSCTDCETEENCARDVKLPTLKAEDLVGQGAGIELPLQIPEKSLEVVTPETLPEVVTPEKPVDVVTPETPLDVVTLEDSVDVVPREKVACGEDTGADSISITIPDMDTYRNMEDEVDAALSKQGLDQSNLRGQEKIFTNECEECDAEYAGQHPDGPPASHFPLTMVLPVIRAVPNQDTLEEEQVFDKDSDFEDDFEEMNSVNYDSDFEDDEENPLDGGTPRDFEQAFGTNVVDYDSDSEHDEKTPLDVVPPKEFEQPSDKDGVDNDSDSEYDEEETPLDVGIPKDRTCGEDGGADAITITIADMDAYHNMEDEVDAMLSKLGLDQSALLQGQVRIFTKDCTEHDEDYAARHRNGPPASDYPLKMVLLVNRGDANQETRDEEESFGTGDDNHESHGEDEVSETRDEEESFRKGDDIYDSGGEDEAP